MNTPDRLSLKFKYSLSALLFLFSIQSEAQDSSAQNINFDFDLGFGVYYQFSTFGNTQLNSAIIPELLPRRINEPEVRRNWNLENDLVSDNPFFHGSYFFRLGGQFVYDSSLYVTAAVNMEQRGFSDGRFSLNTMNLYPYLNARYAKSRGKFSYLLQAGDFWDMKLYEGLTFYNLQTQSWVFKLKYGPFYLKHVGVGDLVRGIGLGIDDLYDYSFGAEELPLSSGSVLLDARVGYSNNRGSLSGGFWNYSSRVKYRKLFELFVQYSSQNSGDAFLVGADLNEQNFFGLNYKVSVDYRSYSSGFNLGYINTVYYRDPNEGAGFTNSTSDVFFPLEFYERPFGQWALFTAYQGRDVQSFSLRGALSYQLWMNTYIRTRLDFNWIIVAEETVLYPFYSIGFGYQSEDDIEIMLEFTNRVMNLDKNYPTLYASDSPYFMIRAYKPLKYLDENDKYHRE